jgi:hypothetical protein
MVSSRGSFTLEVVPLSDPAITQPLPDDGIIGEIGTLQTLLPIEQKPLKNLTPSTWILQRLKETKGAAKPDLKQATEYVHQHAERARGLLADALKGVRASEDINYIGDALIMLREIERLLAELSAAHRGVPHV